MFLRIMNKLDLECMSDTINKEISKPEMAEQILKRLRTSVHILDSAYGESREALSMGGFIFLLTDLSEAEQLRQKILDFYDLSDLDSEYTEEICRDKDNIWIEDMFLRSSEDAIVIIYMKKIA